MGSDLAGAQVHHAGRRIQGPRVGVPLIGRCREAPVGFRQALDGGNGLGAGDRARNARLIALARRLAADMPRKIERVQRLVELPTSPVIAQPPAPRGDVAKIQLVLVGKAKGERLIGKGGRTRLLVGVFRVFPRCRLRCPSGPRAVSSPASMPLVIVASAARAPSSAASPLAWAAASRRNSTSAPVEPAARDHAPEAIGAGVQGRVALSLSLRGDVRGAALERRTGPGFSRAPPPCVRNPKPPRRRSACARALP